MAARDLVSAWFRLSTAPSRLLWRELARRVDAVAEADRQVQALVADWQLARREALDRIGQTLAHAEVELRRELNAEELNAVERDRAARRYLSLSERQLLGALANSYKAMRVLMPRERRIIEHEGKALREPPD
jgi:hypothetical protein